VRVTAPENGKQGRRLPGKAGRGAARWRSAPN
jgi:hypothetical protein